MALASRDATRARESAAAFGVERVHSSYDALLADPDVDAVYIPLPNSLHAEWTIRACRAGKHVLCEKPLALSMAEVDAVAAAAADTGRVVTEAFMYRHHPQTRRIAQLVREGAVGSIVGIRGAFTFSLSSSTDVRLDPALGGGSLWDVGCYPVSFARTVMGEEPEEVFGWQVLSDSGVDETFAGLLRFASGALASFDCGFRAPLRTEMEIVGTQGTLRVPRPFKPGETETVTLVRGAGGDRVEVLDMPGEKLYVGEISDMECSVLDGENPCVSLEDSRGNTATLLALLSSAREGRVVRPSAISQQQDRP